MLSEDLCGFISFFFSFRLFAVNVFEVVYSAELRNKDA